jgi:hypothetical protein
MRTYITIDINQLDLDFSQIDETSKDTVRKSLDDSEFVAKWEGDAPETINNIPESDKSPEMTHAEALELMATPKWTDPNPPE